MKAHTAFASAAIAFGLLSGCASEEAPVAEGEDNLLGFPPLFPDPQGQPTQYPIVLVHGFGGSSKTLGFAEIRDELRLDGHTVVNPELPPFEGVPVRVQFLKDAVDEVLRTKKVKKVNIIAHSMGGLDSRQLISSLGYGDKVASLTTISTPHGGSRFADVGIHVLGGWAEPVIDALASAFGRSINETANDAHFRAAVEFLTVDNAATFNRANPNAKGVYYQSWAGISSGFGLLSADDYAPCSQGAVAPLVVLGPGRPADVVNLSLRSSYRIVAEHLGIFHDIVANDGLVSIDNARWGTFRGCLPADHADEIGGLGTNKLNHMTGWDPVAFYRTVAFELAAKGF